MDELFELDYEPIEFGGNYSIEDLHLLDTHTTSYTKEEFYKDEIVTF